MKKLLLVLMVVAMASFLFVGCLPGVVDDGDDDVDDGVVAVTITSTNWYIDSLTGKNYVPGEDKVTVTLSEAVEDGYAVQVAVKWWNATSEVYVYKDGKWATSTDGKVWTVTYPFNDLAASVSAAYLSDGYKEDCEPVCLVALVKHPCCPGEEVAMEVVYIDDVVPATIDFEDITITDFKDCSCTPPICGPCAVYLDFTSLDPGDACTDPSDGCEDECSGVGEWKFIVDEGCDECVVATGTGCPITVADGCLCFLGSEVTADVEYELTFDIKDNVGNAADSAIWYVRIDSACTIISVAATAQM